MTYGLFLYRRLAVGMSILAAAGMVGCTATIPDVQPFADATTKLQQHTEHAFDVTGASEQDVIALGVDSAQEDKLQKSIDTLHNSMLLRTAALRAFAEYSQRLADIAAAAKSDADKAAEVGDAVKSLVDSVSKVYTNPVVTAAIPAVDSITDLLSSVAQQLIRYKAVSTMGEAVDAASPIVGKLADALSLDLKDLGENLKKASALDEVAGQRADIQINQALKNVREARQTLLAPFQTPTQPKPEVDDKLLGSLEQNERMRKALGAYTSAEVVAAMQDRAEAGVALVEAARGALVDWKLAHENLGKALKEGRAFSFKALADSVAQVATTVEEVKKAGVAIRAAKRAKGAK